jgi:hypothetical protein
LAGNSQIRKVFLHTKTLSIESINILDLLRIALAQERQQPPMPTLSLMPILQVDPGYFISVKIWM